MSWSAIASKVASAAGAASDAVNLGAGVFNLFGWRQRRAHAEAREDTAYQRAAADLEAAGLSKTLAAGGGASSSAGAMSPPSGGSVGALADAQSKKAAREYMEKQTKTEDAKLKGIELQNRILGQDYENNETRNASNYVDLRKKDLEFQQMAKDMEYYNQRGMPWNQMGGMMGQLYSAGSGIKAYWDFIQRYKDSGTPGQQERRAQRNEE
jgi:hypothetical protein